MKQKIRNKMNNTQKWVTQINEKDGLILSNDLDSLFGCVFLKYKFNVDVKAFYDFNDIYYNNLEDIQGDKLIGVDTALYNLRTFDNHFVRIDKTDKVNHRAFNVNTLASRACSDEYTTKYSGSTILQILSYYGYESLYLDGHNDLTKTQKMILLTIDTTFKGLYKNYPYHKAWCDELGITSKFKDVIRKYTLSDMYDFIGEHKIAEDMEILDGEIVTGLDIDFLQEHFPMLDFYGVTRSFKNKINVGKSTYQKVCNWDSLDFYNDKFSVAIVRKDKMMITNIDNEEILEKGIFNYEINSQ